MPFENKYRGVSLVSKVGDGRDERFLFLSQKPTAFKCKELFKQDISGLAILWLLKSQFALSVDERVTNKARLQNPHINRYCTWWYCQPSWISLPTNMGNTTFITRSVCHPIKHPESKRLHPQTPAIRLMSWNQTPPQQTRMLLYRNITYSFAIFMGNDVGKIDVVENERFKKHWPKIKTLQDFSTTDKI